MIFLFGGPALLFLFVVGLIVLLRGWRGTPEFGEPRCSKCGYDLRMLDWSRDYATDDKKIKRDCPECGSNLNKPKAVRFGDYRKRPKLIAVGLVMVGLPTLLVALSVVQAVLGIRWEDFESDNTIIARLETTADQPWDWRKLSSRYAQGELDGEEIEQSINILIAHLNAWPEGKQGPLHWSDDFLSLMEGNGEISQEQYTELAKAFYGEMPNIEMRRTLRQGRVIRFHVQGNPWDLPNCKTAMALRGIRLNGDTDVPVARQGHIQHDKQNLDDLSVSRSWDLDLEFRADMPPGKHELMLDFDFGVFTPNAQFDPRIENERPGQKNKWPQAKTTWSSTLKVPITVVPADQSPVKLESPIKMKSAVEALLQIDEIQVIPRNGKLEFRFKRPSSPDIPMPIAMNVYIVINQQKHLIRRFAMTKNMSAGSGTTHLAPELLPKDLNKIDLLFEPAQDWAENSLEVERIWGTPIEQKDVPLDRYDLDE